jgi:putative SOS response-associated peptidase YedK
MCNRYSSTKNEASLNLRKAVHQFLLAMRPNIAPTQTAPVLRIENDVPKLTDLTWGWKVKFGPLTNARAETASEKVFRDAWFSRHCLVPADGFYEWKTTPEGKQPYRFVLKSREVFWFAGLWQDDQFTILTAPSQGCVKPLHERQPIILAPDALDWWLSSDLRTGDEVIQRCAPTELMECYPVTKRMSSSRYVAPDCVEPVTIAQQELAL